MPATYTFGITGGNAGSMIVNSVTISDTSAKQELRGATGEYAAVGYNKFKRVVTISGVGDGAGAVGSPLGSMPGVSGSYTIDQISTSRSIDGFAEFQITATQD